MIGGNSKIVKDVLPYMITDGVPAAPYGPNVVGLRRAGFSRDDIRDLKQAYRIINRSGNSHSEVLTQLNDLGTKTSLHLAAFMTEQGK